MKPNKEELERYYRTHESERLIFRNLEEADIDRGFHFLKMRKPWRMWECSLAHSKV